MFIVTGGAGFIGANLVKALNLRGERDILVVDELSQGDKYRNLVDCEIADYLDKDDFLAQLLEDRLPQGITALFHQGACSDTMEADGRFMMANNYAYSKALLIWCQRHGIPFFYASSASVYGGGTVFEEKREHEAPLNVYGYSKFLFDQWVRNLLPHAKAPIVGLRYFNVYGPREQHKGRMASVAFHFFNQYQADGHVRLFAGSGGYADGEQRRDFVYVQDVVDVNLFFLDQDRHHGIFNLGSGRAQCFNDVAAATINAITQNPQSITELQAQSTIRYIDMPSQLKGKYQNYTEANISALRQAGYTQPTHSVQDGVGKYVQWLLAHHD